MPAGDGFLAVVSAYYNSLKAGFTPPVVLGEPVDLYTVRAQTGSCSRALPARVMRVRVA
jgi:hypothetical protein